MYFCATFSTATPPRRPLMIFFCAVSWLKVTKQSANKSKRQQIQAQRNVRFIHKVKASLAKASNPSDDKSTGAWNVRALHDCTTHYCNTEIRRYPCNTELTKPGQSSYCFLAFLFRPQRSIIASHSKWGADEKIGAANYVNPQQILDATR